MQARTASAAERRSPEAAAPSASLRISAMFTSAPGAEVAPWSRRGWDGQLAGLIAGFGIHWRRLATTWRGARQANAPLPARPTRTPDGPYAAHPATVTMTMTTIVTRTRGHTPGRGRVTSLTDNCTFY